jgi:COMPASS component SWD2
MAYDQQGLVFAVSTEDGVIKLYDVRSYEKGPFTTFDVESRMSGQPNTFTSLQFSYDGRKLVATMPRQVLLLDAYDVRYFPPPPIPSSLSIPHHRLQTASGQSWRRVESRRDGTRLKAWANVGGKKYATAKRQNSRRVTFCTSSH